jgi:hypothetical protein
MAFGDKGAEDDLLIIAGAMSDLVESDSVVGQLLNVSDTADFDRTLHSAEAQRILQDKIQAQTERVIVFPDNLIYEDFTSPTLNVGRWKQIIEFGGAEPQFSIVDDSGGDPTFLRMANTATATVQSTTLQSVNKFDCAPAVMGPTETTYESVVFDCILRLQFNVADSSQVVTGWGFASDDAAFAGEFERVQIGTIGSTIFASTESGNVLTATTVGTSPDVQEWNRYTIEIKDSIVNFYINSTLVAAHTTNLSDTPMPIRLSNFINSSHSFTESMDISTVLVYNTFSETLP